MSDSEHKTDYEQTAAYFRELHETRFKLLALLPIAVGAAIAVLPEHTSPMQQMALGALGLVITIGLTIYDQRNTMIYDRLVRRAQLLERLMKFPPVQLGPGERDRMWGGAFKDRPERRHLLKTERIAIPLIWHDLGLSIVYAATLAGWAFILTDGMSKQGLKSGALSILSSHPLLVSSAVAIVAFAALWVLAKLNDRENCKIDKWTESDEPLGGGEPNSPPQRTPPAAE